MKHTTGLNILGNYVLIVGMEAHVEKVYPLVKNVKALDTAILKEVASALRKVVTADDALKVLQAVVAKWQQETKEVVTFELEATLGPIVSAAFAQQVAVVEVSCASMLYSLFCRSVRNVEQAVVSDLSGAVVDSSLPQQVKDVALNVLEEFGKVVDSVVDKVDDMAEAAGVGLVRVDLAAAAVVPAAVAAPVASAVAAPVASAVAAPVASAVAAPVASAAVLPEQAVATPPVKESLPLSRKSSSHRGDKPLA